MRAARPGGALSADNPHWPLIADATARIVPNCCASSANGPKTAHPPVALRPNPPQRGAVKRIAVPLLLTALTACGQDEPQQAQRVSLDEARHVPAAPIASPDTKAAGWAVSQNGQAIRFGNPGQPPLLTLECRLRDNPVGLRIVRHTAARPGEKALFPVIGNGLISRFKLDGTLRDDEWRWEGTLPASDPLLDVFIRGGKLEATLPGGGSLQIEASRIPGEFVTWCRAGGKVQRVEAAEKAAEPKATDKPAR